MRPHRIDYPGARHHVMNRGARSGRVFFDDASRELFLRTVAELVERFGLRIHGYALMPNHYHLMIESPAGRLSRAMKHLGGTYTQRVNRRYGWDGALFRGRFKSRLVDSERYWRHLLVYLHLNPWKAGIRGPEGEWTSDAYYRGVQAPDWMSTDELSYLFGTPEAYAAACDAVRRGVVPDPAEFDPDALWSPPEPLVAPEISRPASMLQALDEVRAVTGRPVERLLRPTRGTGDPANWLAAWWMSMRGIEQGRIKRAMGVGDTQVSRLIRRVEARRRSDPELGRWVEALRMARSSG